MATMHHLLFIVLLCLSIKNIHSKVAFGDVCSIEIQATGLTSVDGNDDFEIELHEEKFLPDDVITGKKKRIIHEN